MTDDTIRLPHNKGHEFANILTMDTDQVCFQISTCWFMNSFVGTIVANKKIVERVASLWKHLKTGSMETHNGEVSRGKTLFVSSEESGYRVLRIETQNSYFLCYFQCVRKSRRLHVRMFTNDTKPEVNHFSYGDARDEGFVLSISYYDTDDRSQISATTGLDGFAHFCWFVTQLEHCECVQEDDGIFMRPS